MSDTIYKQSAINELRSLYIAQPKITNDIVWDHALDLATDKIECLPSADPEPLTDKEQRIFLSAMERELKICKEVDWQLTREPYEDSLVYMCHEIRRKVKSALWT